MAEPVVQTIYRDPALFYWILLPITVVMVSVPRPMNGQFIHS